MEKQESREMWMRLHDVASAGEASKLGRSGLKLLDSRLLQNQALVETRHPIAVCWAIQSVNYTDEHGEVVLSDAGKRPVALFALAFAVLRLALATTIRQAKARLCK